LSLRCHQGRQDGAGHVRLKGTTGVKRQLKHMQIIQLSKELLGTFELGQPRQQMRPW
jgi:hypothetical protein